MSLIIIVHCIRKKQQPTFDGSGAMMEDDGAGGRRQERAEGNVVHK
jgi:hypothetical protein